MSNKVILFQDATVQSLNNLFKLLSVACFALLHFKWVCVCLYNDDNESYIFT
jgi:hypothetical protein